MAQRTDLRAKIELLVLRIRLAIIDLNEHVTVRMARKVLAGFLAILLSAMLEFVLQRLFGQWLG